MDGNILQTLESLSKFNLTELLKQPIVVVKSPYTHIVEKLHKLGLTSRQRSGSEHPDSLSIKKVEDEVQILVTVGLLGGDESIRKMKDGK